jgi:hypothetical protein
MVQRLNRLLQCCVYPTWEENRTRTALVSNLIKKAKENLKLKGLVHRKYCGTITDYQNGIADLIQNKGYFAVNWMEGTNYIPEVIRNFENFNGIEIQVPIDDSYGEAMRGTYSYVDLGLGDRGSIQYVGGTSQSGKATQNAIIVLMNILPEHFEDFVREFARLYEEAYRCFHQDEINKILSLRKRADLRCKVIQHALKERFKIEFHCSTVLIYDTGTRKICFELFPDHDGVQAVVKIEELESQKFLDQLISIVHLARESVWHFSSQEICREISKLSGA